ncbi:MAG: hypothetical protein HYS98_04245 [Deltaproteobacteria bacterium]|nr:hypothetical protein [Deltaproteobacteria bacterium]
MDKTLLFSIINFFLFIIILWALLRKSSHNQLKARNEKIGEDFRLSQEMHHFAEESLKTSERQLAQLVFDKENLHREFEQRLEQYRKKEQERANEEVQQLNHEWKKKMDSLLIKMQAEVENQTKKQLLEYLKKQLKTQVTSNMHEKMIQNSLKQIQEV